MPSDDRSRAALDLLAPAREAFRTAVVATAEEVRAFLATQKGPADGETPGRDVGDFGSELIDTERFAALFAGTSVLDLTALQWIEEARSTLDELTGLDDALYAREVPSGGDVAGTVREALAELGRAFAAAAVAATARSGGAMEPLAGSLEAFPPERWNRAERQLAPPLIVELDGADLRVDGLADLLDGRQKLVLIVRGPVAPAPLVRLITPRVLVAQVASVAELERLVGFDGPAVVALVADGAALFTHDPEATPTLSAAHLPDEPPRKAVGGVTVFRQAEDLGQLRRLLEWQAVGPAAAAEGGAAEPVTTADKLAAWLLRQAQLDEAS